MLIAGGEAGMANVANIGLEGMDDEMQFAMAQLPQLEADGEGVLYMDDEVDMEDFEE